LDYLNNGDYAKAFFVSIERAPQYMQVVKGDGYATRIKELEKACEELPFLHVKTAPRQLVSVIKAGIPFGISPEYKVSFISKAKNGVLLQQVILKYKTGKAPGKSYFHTKYRLKFVPNEVRQ